MPGVCTWLYRARKLPITAAGHHCRVVVATYQASATASPVGTTREEVVYELFFTALPAESFTAIDVVKLYLHRGSFETTLADEDREQNSDRWCSYTAHGQEFAQILAQWMWNVRQELSQQWQPTPMHQTKFAEAQAASEPVSKQSPAQQSFGPPQWARAARAGSFGGHDFVSQPDGTLRCPQGAALYPPELRLEHDGTLRILYAARIADCRSCPLREQCQGHGTSTKKPRRVSAVLYPQPQTTPEEQPPPCLPASHPILWDDWPRCEPRRAWTRWLRNHLVTVDTQSAFHPPPTQRPRTRAQRAHWRLSWEQRLTRNARPPAAPPVAIIVYGLPMVFAQSLGLRVA